MMRAYFPPSVAEQKFEQSLEYHLSRVICGHLPHAGILVYLRSNHDTLDEARLCTDCVHNVTRQVHQLRSGAVEHDVQPTRDVPAFAFIGATSIVTSVYFYRYALFF